MPRIQCETTFNGSHATLYGFCSHFEPGDHTPCFLDSVFFDGNPTLADELTPDQYDTLCEFLSLNAELQH